MACTLKKFCGKGCLSFNPQSGKILLHVWLWEFRKYISNSKLLQARQKSSFWDRACRDPGMSCLMPHCWGRLQVFLRGALDNTGKKAMWGGGGMCVSELCELHWYYSECCNTVTSDFKLTKDPGECFAKPSRLPALAQPPSIVSANVQPNPKPGAVWAFWFESCLGTMIAWAKLWPSVPPCWRIGPGAHFTTDGQQKTMKCHRFRHCCCQSSTRTHRSPGWWVCGCRSTCPWARSPRPQPGELPGSVAKS